MASRGHSWNELLFSCRLAVYFVSRFSLAALLFAFLTRASLNFTLSAKIRNRKFFSRSNSARALTLKIFSEWQGRQWKTKRAEKTTKNRTKAHSEECVLLDGARSEDDVIEMRLLYCLVHFWWEKKKRRRSANGSESEAKEASMMKQSPCELMFFS